MGLSSSSDEWCRHSDRAIEGFEWAKKIVDDILIWASTLEELGQRIRQVAERCRQLNIALSRSKMEIGDKISFTGLSISPTSISPDPEQIRALREFPRPKDTTGVRAFLGLANQLSGFVPDYAHMTVKLRGLTGKNSSFLWLDDLQSEFDKIKDLLTGNLVVTSFDPNREPILLTDASRLHGLSFALGHMVNNQFKIVSCGSKSRTRVLGNLLRHNQVLLLFEGLE